MNWARISDVLKHEISMLPGTRCLGLYEVGEQEFALTDYYMMLCIESSLPDGFSTKKADERWIENYRRIKDEKYSSLIDVSMTNLKDFLGDPYWPKAESCPKCNGSGFTPCGSCFGRGLWYCECSNCGHVHEAICEDCDGSGKTECDHESVRESRTDDWIVFFGDLGFDKLLLARALDFCPGQDLVLVELIDDDGRAQIRISGQGWTLIVVGIEDAKSIIKHNENNTFQWEVYKC